MVYRASMGGCPRCGARFDDERWGDYSFWRCPVCNGVWMEESTLKAMLAEMGKAVDGVPSTASTEEVIACTFCSEPMRKAMLFSILLDCCDRHGVWFDNAELQKTLAGSAGLEVDPRTPTNRGASLLQQVLSGSRKS